MTEDLINELLQAAWRRENAMLFALANKRNSYGKNGGSVARQKRESKKRRNKRR
jgi:hypothetical protein